MSTARSLKDEINCLADRIASFPKIRLCQEVSGQPHLCDYLLSERDRYLIVQALRASAREAQLRLDPHLGWVIVDRDEKSPKPSALPPTAPG